MEKTEGLKLPSVLLKGEIALSLRPCASLLRPNNAGPGAPGKIFPGTIVQSLIEDLLDEYFKMNGYSRSGDLTDDSKSLVSGASEIRDGVRFFLIRVKILI